MNKLDDKLIEILTIISEHNEPVGAKIIASELKKRGYEIGERAVRYHLQVLDENDLTEKIGYAGRKITEKGLDEIDKANISYRIGSIYSQIMDKLYLSNFPTKVIVNKTKIIGDYREIKDLALKVIECGYAIGDYINIRKSKKRKTNYYDEEGDIVTVETLCSISFDNFLLKNGIMPSPLYGGIVKYEDYEPVYFEGTIDFKKTSIDPLEAFISRGKTEVLNLITSGDGYIPANFRVIPKNTKDKFEVLLKKDLLNGIISYGTDNVLGINLNEGEIGVAVIGGLTPICPSAEKGYSIEFGAASSICDLSKLNKKTKKYITPVNKKCATKLSSVLSKMNMMMEQVNYDIETEKGTVLVNTAYIDGIYKDEVINILYECISKKQIISNKIGISSHKYKIKIQTLCSSTIDGIFLKEGIPIIPHYGGILELKNKRFIDTIAYDGTSLDPHEVFFNKADGINTLLSGIREFPASAKDELAEVMNKLNWTGIINIGKPNNPIYGIKVNKGMVGFASIGGMNPFAIIKNSEIPIEIKALHETVKYEDLINIKEL